MSATIEDVESALEEIADKSSASRPLAKKHKKPKRILDLPKSLKVGGHRVKIIHPYDFPEGAGAIADYDQATNQIRIGCISHDGRYISKSYAFICFLHELLHAIDETSSHHIFIDHEDALDAVSEGLYQVLVDNKSIRDLLHTMGRVPRVKKK